MINQELIEQLMEYPLDAKCVLKDGNLIELDAINPKGPQCVIWLQPIGTRVMAEIASENKQPPETSEGEEWKI